MSKDRTSDDSFSEGEKAIIEKIAYAVGENLIGRFSEKMLEAFKLHTTDCPYGKKITRAFWIGVGIGIGITVVTGTVTLPTLLRVL